MPELTPELAEQLLAHWQANVEPLAVALGAALDAEVSIAIGETMELATDDQPEGFDGPGLLVLLRCGGSALAAMLPESSGLLPDWSGTLDQDDQKTLSALASELSSLLLPEPHKADQATARSVKSLSAAVHQGEPTEGAKRTTLKLKSNDAAGSLSIVWPLAQPGHVLPGARDASDSSAAPSESTRAETSTTGERAAASRYDRLPPYTRSLLKVRLPVHVQLASRKEGVQEIIEMAPGAIVKFDKPCDDLLHLYVGDQAVAEGEAVKVGDKFGFRVTRMLMPKERFAPVRPAKKAS